MQKHPKGPVTSRKKKGNRSWGRVTFDPEEGGYETESDPTPILDEAPTVGKAKRKREVSTNQLFAPAPGSHTKIIVLQDCKFRIESNQKAEGIVQWMGSTA